MANFEIGVIIDSFRLDFDEAIKKAKEVGASGIQVYATNGAMSPENLSIKQRKEILDKVTSKGLIISALCGDLGSGFTQKETNKSKIDKSKRIMELAKDLNTNIITTHFSEISKSAGFYWLQGLFNH